MYIYANMTFGHHLLCLSLLDGIYIKTRMQHIFKCTTNISFWLFCVFILLSSPAGRISSHHIKWIKKIAKIFIKVKKYLFLDIHMMESYIKKIIIITIFFSYCWWHFLWKFIQIIISVFFLACSWPHSIMYMIWCVSFDIIGAFAAFIWVL